MKKVVIIGAGQMGRAVRKLLNPNKIEFLGFADNDSSKWTSLSVEGEAPESGRSGCESTAAPGVTGGDRVFSVKVGVDMNPDMIIISVMGDERARALKEQVRVCRFYGDILFLNELKDIFDIRSRCIMELAERVAGVDGAVAELGVYKGDTAVLLNGLFPSRPLYLFDTFQGFDERDIAAEQQGSPLHSELSLSHAKAGDFGDTSVEGVLSRMPYPDRCIVRKGYFPETASDLSDSEFAFVSIDPDLYEPALAGLRFFYDRLNAGGVIVLHDYNNTQFKGIKKAVAKFEEELAAAGQPPLKLVPLGDLHGSCVIVK